MTKSGIPKNIPIREILSSSPIIVRTSATIPNVFVFLVGVPSEVVGCEVVDVISCYEKGIKNLTIFCIDKCFLNAMEIPKN
jgi:hypothetical protein